MRINVPFERFVTNDNCTAILQWNPNFQSNWERRYERVQRFVDSEVIRLCDPYTPFYTGMLKRSAILGTVIGKGEVIWNMLYAKYLYYGVLMVSPTTGSSWAKLGERKILTEKHLSFNGAPKRGKMWFERMKSDHKDKIISGARRVMGGLV